MRERGGALRHWLAPDANLWGPDRRFLLLADDVRGGLEVPGSIRVTPEGRKVSLKPMHPEFYAVQRDYYLAGPMDARALLFDQAPFGLATVRRPWSPKMIERRSGSGVASPA